MAIISRDADNQITAPLHHLPFQCHHSPEWTLNAHYKCGNQRAKFNSVVTKTLPFWKIFLIDCHWHHWDYLYTGTIFLFFFNFVNMLMKKMQWINNDKGKLIIISIWFSINSINQSIEIVSWNVNILKDESVRKGEVLVMVVEDKLSSVGPVDQTIINIITPTLITTTQHHITPPPHHGNTSRLPAGEDLGMNAGISLYSPLGYRGLTYEPRDGDIKLFWLIKRGTLDHSLLYQHLHCDYINCYKNKQCTNKQQTTVSRCIFYLYTLLI